MNRDLVSQLLTSSFAGAVVVALIAYVRDRRRDRTDYTVATYQTLAQMNDRLKAEINETRERHAAEVAELQRELDTERRQRRLLEDRVARLERER